MSMFLDCFRPLRTYCGEVDTGNHEVICFSSQRVPNGLSPAEKPLMILHNAAHLYREHPKQASMLVRIYQDKSHDPVSTHLRVRSPNTRPQQIPLFRSSTFFSHDNKSNFHSPAHSYYPRGHPVQNEHSTFLLWWSGKITKIFIFVKYAI